MLLKRTVFSIFLLTMTVVSLAQRSREPPHNPHTISSPSGSTKLWINPSDIYGQGKSFCRMTKNGKVVWQKDLPFTFEEAHISDSGTIGGSCHNRRRSNGQFTVAIVDPTGKVCLEHNVPNHGPYYVDLPSLPWYLGTIFDPDHDRMIVRLKGETKGLEQESWLVFRLSSAKYEQSVPMADKLDQSNKRIENAELVPGTNLILVSWLHFDEKYGHSLTLVDQNYKKVWGMDLPADLHNGLSGDDADKLYNQFRGRGAILRTDQARRFEVRLFKMNKRVTFEAHPTGKGWDIKEVSREPYVATVKSLPKPMTVRSASLPILKSFAVPQSADFGSSVGDIGQFHFWGKDKIVYLRESVSPSIDVVDLEGKVIRSIPVPAEAKAEGMQLFLAKTSGARYVMASADNSTKGRPSRAWNVDVASGKFSPMPKFKSAWITALAAYPDGHFTTITHDFNRSMSVTQVSLYSPEGDLVWAKGDGWSSNDKANIFSPEGVDVDSKGRILVLSKIANTLQFFEKSGKFVRSIDLDKKWGRKLSYPTNVAALPDGRLWLYDFGSDQPCYLLDASGGIIRSFKQRFSNGKAFDSHEGITPDSDGEAWVSNGKSIFKLGKDGVVIHTIGNKPRTSGLGAIMSLHVGFDGRVYALDEATHSVFAFNHLGKTLFTFIPKPKEFDDSPNYGRMEVSESGDMFLSGSRDYRYLHISPSGMRLPSLTGPNHERNERNDFGIPFTMKPSWRWWGSKLIDESGKPRAAMARWPDLAWMSDSAPIQAPDHRLMAFEGTIYPERTGRRLRIAFFKGNGMPESQSYFPAGMPSTSDAAYDGTTCYFITKEGLLAMNKRAEPLWIYRPPRWNSRNSWKVYPSLGGIALYDGLRTVTWFDPKKVQIGSERVTLEMSEEARNYLKLPG